MKYLGVSERMTGCRKETGWGLLAFLWGVERLSPEMKKVTISYSVMRTQNVGSVVQIYLGEGRAKLITGKVHIFSQECGKWADKRGNETEDPRKLC